MARTYKRDARGRFAGGGSSSGGGSKGKTLKRGRAQLSEARGKVRTAKGKLAAFDPADQTIKSSLSKRAQRGAVTKAEKRLTAVKRTAVIKGRRMTGTIGKPKGLKPGTLKGRGVSGRTGLQPKNTGPGGKKRWLSSDQVIQANEARFKGVRETAQILRSKLPKKLRDYYRVTTVGGLLAKYQGKALDFGSGVRLKNAIESVTGIRRNPLHGVRETIDNQRKTVRIDLSPVARRQAAIGEKVGNRKPRRRRR